MEKVFPVVRLRGLPFNANDFDILEFFQGLEPVDVLMFRRVDAPERRTSCLVTYADGFALQKNRQSMGRRYKVFRSRSRILSRRAGRERARASRVLRRW